VEELPAAKKGLESWLVVGRSESKSDPLLLLLLEELLEVF